MALLVYLFLLFWRCWPVQSAWLFGILISAKQTMVVWVPFGLALMARTLPRWHDPFIWLAKSATAELVPMVLTSGLPCLILPPAIRERLQRSLGQ